MIGLRSNKKKGRDGVLEKYTLVKERSSDHLSMGNQQSIIKGPREYEGYYVLVAWWREKERRCWDFIESMSISKGDKQTHHNAENNEIKIGQINELKVCVWTQYIRQPWLLDLSDIDFGLMITRLMWILVYRKQRTSHQIIRPLLSISIFIRAALSFQRN